MAEAQWNYAREITINNPGLPAKDAVIEVLLDSGFSYAKAKADGSDIRFSWTDVSGSDPKLSYWIEQWNVSGISRIWVKAPTLPAANSKLYMYYGNGSATAVSNGPETFLFFDDFQDGTFAGKWTNLSIGTVVEKDGTLQLTENNGEEGILTTSFTLSGRMVVRALYQRGRGDGHWTRGGIGGWNHWFCFGDHTNFAGSGTNYVMMYDSASMSNINATPLKKVSNQTINGQWRRIAYWYDGANLMGMQDSTTVDWAANDVPSKLALRTMDNDASDNYEFISVSNYLKPEPKLAVGPEANANSLALPPWHGERVKNRPSRHGVLPNGRRAESGTPVPNFERMPVRAR